METAVKKIRENPPRSASSAMPFPWVGGVWGVGGETAVFGQGGGGAGKQGEETAVSPHSFRRPSLVVRHPSSKV